MFEPEKEIEYVHKRIDRLTEYTSYHLDLINHLLTMVEFLHATLLKVQSEDYRDKNKSTHKELERNLSLLRSQVDYLNDKVKEKRTEAF